MYDTRNGRMDGFLKDQIIDDTSFSANGALLITYNRSNNRKEIEVWETASGRVPKFLKDQKIDDASFSANGAWLYTHNDRGESQVWETATEKMHNFLKDRKDIKNARFSPKGTMLITSSIIQGEWESQVWETASEKVPDFLKGQNGIYYANFSADMARLITINNKGESTVWETAAAQTPNPLKYLTYERGFLEASFSADGTLLITYSKLQGEWEYRVRETASGQVPDFLKDQTVRYASLSPDGSWLFTKTYEGESHVWGTARRQEPDFLKEVKKINFADFSADGAWLITCGEEGKFHVWDTRNGRMHDFLKEQNDILNARFSSKGALIITNRLFQGEWESQMWETDSKGLPYYLKDKKKIIYARFSADGRWCITRYVKGELRMWETSIGEVHNLFLRGRGEIDAYFGADSELMIEYHYESLQPSYISHFWRGEIKSDIMFDFLKDQKNVSLIFSPNEKIVITGNRTDKELPVEEIGEKLSNYYLKGQNDTLSTFVSADGNLRATLSNKIIITINVATGKTIQTLYINTKPTQIQLLQNRYLYVVADKAIIKTDILTQHDNLFSYGDGENLDYTYEEIKEWLNVFRNDYLRPLDERNKEKYGVKE